MSEVSMIGLDLAKNVFQVHGADASGAILSRKKLRRDQMLKFFDAQPACNGCHGGLRQQPLLGAGDHEAGT